MMDRGMMDGGIEGKASWIAAARYLKSYTWTDASHGHMRACGLA